MGIRTTQYTPTPAINLPDNEFELKRAVVRRRGHDLAAHSCIRCEDAMIPNHVKPRRRNESTQSRNQIEWVEEQA